MQKIYKSCSKRKLLHCNIKVEVNTPNPFQTNLSVKDDIDNIWMKFWIEYVKAWVSKEPLITIKFLPLALKFVLLFIC